MLLLLPHSSESAINHGDQCSLLHWKVEASSNVMAQAQKADFVFRRNGRVHLNRRGRQFSQLLAAELCAPAVVMLDTPCSEVVWRVLATHSIRQFPLHFLSRASPCAITFQLESTTWSVCQTYVYGEPHVRLLTGLLRVSWKGWSANTIYRELQK